MKTRASIALAAALLSGAAAQAQTVEAAATPAAPARSYSEKACVQSTDQASAFDLKAATAQGERKDLVEVAELYRQAALSWGAAVESCEGRGQERARRNLVNSQKILASVSELQGSGPQCEATQKDATSLNNLAKQAADDKRYSDASVLYRKAADLWDLATERCSGTQQQAAATRRSQSETDAYNAEFCVPVYVQARDQTQRLKSASAGLSTVDKQALSRTAETSWREAAAQCKGPAVDIALNNAQSLAKERGSALPQPVAAVPSTAAQAAPARSGAMPAMASAAAQPGLATAPKEVDVTAGATRFAGKFTLDPGGLTYSGSGRVSWTNGDLYEGTLVQGHREGKGKFTWPSGQVYDGEWRNDVPNGQGVVQFANGNRYEGVVVAGIPNGSGKMAYANGDSYAGEMRDGIPNGHGTFFWKGGDRYSGQWKAGLKEGTGTFTWARGDRWEGVYRNDQQTDIGKLIRLEEQKPAAVSGTATASAR
jgi:hypothetical protein